MEKEKSYEAAIYLRLSKDDGDFCVSETRDGNRTEKTESNSIQNQRELLKAFIAGHPDIRLADEFKDDGWTGTDFDRPDFRRMIDAIRAGKINCVIVKDLSRFGRDYIGCGNYIERMFPQYGVRFIALNDSFDTADRGSANNIILPFKNLINDSYSRDISVKVRSNLEAKRRQGEFISSFTVYGYEKDPENRNRIVVCEYAAAVVRDIFKWKMEGLSPERIAERLNGLGILSPMEYKRYCGSRFQSRFKTGAQAKWSHVAVRRILQNEIYTGVMLQGKSTTPNYKTKKAIYKDESEWVRVEGTHEAIISRHQFEMIQRLLKEDTRSANDDLAVYPYCGRIFCADCGAAAVRKSVNAGGKRYVYYVCGANKGDKALCSSHSIREDVLDAAVLATVQRYIDVALDMDRAMEQIEQLTWEHAELEHINASIGFQEQIINRNNELRLSVYEDLQNGILTQDEFLMLKKEFGVRIEEASGIIAKLNSSKTEIEYGMSNKQGWLSQFREYENIRHIDRRLVVNLIERINIHEGSEIEVIFRQSDQFAAIVDFLRKQNKMPVQTDKVVSLSKMRAV